VSSGITPTPAYDKNGNQLTSTPATLTWNALNQPVSIDTSSASSSAVYDALGRMVQKSSGGSIWKYVYRPSGAMLAVYTASLVKGMVPLPGGGTAIYNSSGLDYIRHKDWLGSSRLATTWAHAVYAKESYAPFGETYNEQGTADRSFTGEDQNVVTGSAGSGVYDYLFRKYDPSAGRWLSPDPSGWGVVSQADPQSLNRYSYVENQPMAAVDPNGLACVYANSGGVSVSNWGGDSLDESTCEQAGGNYEDGYIDPDSVSGAFENGGFMNPDGSGTVGFVIASGDGSATFSFGGQAYPLLLLGSPDWEQIGSTLAIATPPWLPQNRFVQGQGKSPGSPTPSPTPREIPGPKPTWGPADEPPLTDTGKFWYTLTQILRIIGNAPKQPVIPVIVNPCYTDPTLPGCGAGTI